MTLTTLDEAVAKVRHYFAHEWKGGKLHINGVSRMVGNDYDLALSIMEYLGETSEFIYDNQPICPEQHDCEPDGYCDECGLTYSPNQIGYLRYIYPSPESGIKPLVFSDSEAPKYIEAIRSVVPDMGALTAYAIAEAVIKASRTN